MKTKTYKRFGFFSALAMVVGAVVGIGIFVKNGGIFKDTGGNSVAILLAWVFGGLVALMSAISFSEITKSDVSTNGGLGKYAEVYVGKKFSYFIRTTFPLVYYTILQAALAYFTYLFFTLAFNGNVTLMGTAIVIFVAVPTSTLINVYVPNGTKGLMGLSLIVKFIPLIVAALIGLWFTSNGGGIGSDLSSPTDDKWTPVSTFSGILIALPSVLFAFDAFVGVGAIAKDTKNAERTIPLAVAFGMIFVTIIYILITISQINHNSGSVSGLISTVFGTEVFSKIIEVIIVISALGTYSAITTSYVNLTQDAIEQDILPFSKSMLKRWGNKAGAWFAVAWSFLFTIPIMIMQVSFEVDMLDEFSNMPTLFFMIFYSVVFLGFVVDKIKHGEKGLKRMYLIIIGILASTSIIFIVGYQFYDLTSNWITLIKEGVEVGEDKLTMGQEIAKRMPLIIFPLLLLLVPAGLLFVKQKFELKKPFKASFCKAIRFRN